MIGEILGFVLSTPFAYDVAGKLFSSGVEKTLEASDKVKGVWEEVNKAQDKETSGKTLKLQGGLDLLKTLPPFDDSVFYTCITQFREETQSFIDWHEAKEGFTSEEAIKDESGNQIPHARLTENGWIYTLAQGADEWVGVQANVEEKSATLVIAKRAEGDDWLVSKAILERNKNGDDYPCALYFIGEAWRAKKKGWSTIFEVSDEVVGEFLQEYFSQSKKMLLEILQEIDKPDSDKPDSDIVADLNNLCEMKEKGLLTAEEFKQAKQKLLGAIPPNTPGNVVQTPAPKATNSRNDLARARGAPRITDDDSALICSACGSHHGLKSDWHLTVINCDCGALIDVSSGEVSSSNQLNVKPSSTGLLYDVWVTGIGNFNINDGFIVEVGKLIDPTQQHLFINSLGHNLKQLKKGTRTQVLITTKISDAQSQKSRLRLEELGLIAKVERNYSH